MGEQVTGQGPPPNLPTRAAPPPLGPRIGRGRGYLWLHLAWGRAPPLPVAPPPSTPDWSPPWPSLGLGQWGGRAPEAGSAAAPAFPRQLSPHHASSRAKPVCRALLRLRLPPVAAAARTPAVERAAGGSRRPGAGHGRAACTAPCPRCRPMSCARRRRRGRRNQCADFVSFYGGLAETAERAELLRPPGPRLRRGPQPGGRAERRRAPATPACRGRQPCCCRPRTGCATR